MSKLLVIETKRPILSGLIVFAIIALLTQLLAYQRYLIFKDTEQQKILKEANSIKDQLTTSLSYSLSATKTLAFLVDQYGVPDRFDSVARHILESNKFVDAVELTDKGVITHVYPLKGNETVLGYNIFKDTLRNQEAFKALEKRRLYFAGPFELVQGGVAVVGRLPMFKKNEFVGFSVVLIKLSTLMKAAGLDQPKDEYHYQLSKINPTSGKEEFFIEGPKPTNPNYSVAVEFPDGEWKLYVIPKQQFYNIPSGVFISLLGLLFSATAGLLTWYIVRQPEKLNQLVQEKASEVINLKRNAVTTIERVSDAFVALDKNWNYTYANKKAGEILGRDPDELIGKNAWAEFPESVGTSIYHICHTAFEEQRYMHLEEYFEPFAQWLESHVYPSPDGVSIYFRNVTESRKAAQKLEASEKYFRTLIEKSTDAIVLFDSLRKIVYHSPSTERITGYVFDEIHNKFSLDFVHGSQKKYIEEVIASIMDKQGGSAKAKFQFRHKNGHYIWIEGTYTNWLQDPNIKAVVFNYQDVTDRVDTEKKINAANRFYRFTSRVNQMMIHAKDEQTVFEEVCTIAVEVGKFRMAWVGKIDAEKNEFVPIAYAGHEEGYISAAKNLRLNEPVFMAGPTGTALRTGMYFSCNDIENDSTARSWAPQALAQGYHASIAIPFRKGDKVVGVFHIYSEEKYCFNENEISLLEETTRNISFTLESIENEQLRQKAEHLIANEKILSDSIINGLPGVFYLYDHNGKFLRWNRNLELVTGYSGEEIKNIHPLEFFQGDDRQNVGEKIQEVFEIGKAEVTAYFTSKTGERIPFYFNGIKVNFDGADYLIGMGIDITHRVNAENELLERTEEIQRLTGYLQNIREEERTHIAREIHDVIGQQLTAMKMDASFIRKKIPPSEIVMERLNDIISLIDETIKTVRRISSELRPVMLDDFGLASALEWQTTEFEKNSGIRTVFTNACEEEDLDRDLATNIFRVYQEALTNIARHSGATHVTTSLRTRHGILQLSVADNGVGFDVQEVKKKKSLGLLGMRERARMFDGHLIFAPNDPSGTTIILSIPIRKSVKEYV